MSAAEAPSFISFTPSRTIRQLVSYLTPLENPVVDVGFPAPPITPQFHSLTFFNVGLAELGTLNLLSAKNFRLSFTIPPPPPPTPLALTVWRSKRLGVRGL